MIRVLWLISIPSKKCTIARLCARRSRQHAYFFFFLLPLKKGCYQCACPVNELSGILIRMVISLYKGAYYSLFYAFAQNLKFTQNNLVRIFHNGSQWQRISTNGEITPNGRGPWKLHLNIYFWVFRLVLDCLAYQQVYYSHFLAFLKERMNSPRVRQTLQTTKPEHVLSMRSRTQVYCHTRTLFIQQQQKLHIKRFCRNADMSYLLMNAEENSNFSS